MHFKTALECVNWPGRLQRIKDNPKIYVDVSHNLSGFEKTLDFIKSIFNKKNSQLLIGLLDDKDFQKIVPLTISVFSKFWITEPENHRKLSAQILKKEYTKIMKLASEDEFSKASAYQREIIKTQGELQELNESLLYN